MIFFTFLCRPIHAQHPDANCVMHTHQPEITALCCLEDHGLPMLHQNCQMFYDDIALDTYNGLILDPSEGNHLVGECATSAD